jgi:predicted nucleotidyltransferase
VRVPNAEERDTGAAPLTQFGRMCARLGIRIIPASSPQAKGRIDAIGIYGMVAYAVTQRTHEIGIRMALGARRAAVLQLVIGQNAASVLAGIAIGLAGAAVTTRYLQALLFGLTPLDLSTFAITSAALRCGRDVRVVRAGAARDEGRSAGGAAPRVAAAPTPLCDPPTTMPRASCRGPAWLHLNVRVFGSFARGDAQPNSDVDFLVDVEPGRTLLDVIAFEQALEMLLGRTVDVVSDGGLSPSLQQRILAEAAAL